MSSAPLLLLADRLAPELTLEYTVTAPLGEARAHFTWRRELDSCCVRMEGFARILIKRFPARAESVRDAVSGLESYTETLSEKARGWTASSSVSSRAWVAAIELPFALASCFQEGERRYEGVLLAGTKPYRTIVQQRAAPDSADGPWAADVEIWSLANDTEPARLRTRLQLILGKTGFMTSLSAQVPLAGAITARLAGGESPAKDSSLHN